MTKWYTLMWFTSIYLFGQKFWLRNYGSRVNDHPLQKSIWSISATTSNNQSFSWLHFIINDYRLGCGHGPDLGTELRDSASVVRATMVIGLPMNSLILVLGLSNQMKPHLFLLANMTICDIFLLSNGFLVIKILTEPNWTVTSSNYAFMNFVCKDWVQNKGKQRSHTDWVSRDRRWNERNSYEFSQLTFYLIRLNLYPVTVFCLKLGLLLK